MLIINVIDYNSYNYTISDIVNKLYDLAYGDSNLIQCYKSPKGCFSDKDIIRIGKFLSQGKVVFLECSILDIKLNIDRILANIDEVVFMECRPTLTKTLFLDNPIKELYWFGNRQTNDYVSWFVENATLRTNIECSGELFSLHGLVMPSKCKAHVSNFINKLQGFGEIFSQYEKLWLGGR